MEVKPIDLYEFLVESELQHYYNSIKNELKITNAAHLKYASDEDLKQIGLSRPEIRRMRKFYEKYFHHGYLSKIKRLLQPPPRKEDNQNGMSMSSITSTLEQERIPNSPSKSPNNKHIIPADQICVNKQLGSGEFGIVQQGVWTNGTERTQVAIKCLSRERMQSNPMEFLKEAAIMHAIDNENIVRLYGVVLDTDSLMLVTELAHLRSLLECLKDPGLRVSFLTVPTLCEFAMQICNGMMYLENKRLIHRDLAARNILVFSKNKVKISDFGLSRALGVGKDYYKTNFNVNLKLPIAWCAPECINYLRFTNASDVWAYGVCLWEMFSYGFQPWPALTGLQILSAIDEPNYQRLEQPECCPRDYYNLMLKCWQHDAMKRPKFSDIYLALPDMKPEQLKAVVNNLEPRKDHLLFRQGEIITVLDKNCNNNSSFWKGVLNSGKTGFFNPANTVAYVEGLPTSNNRDSFYRSNERGSKKKLRTEMISMPQNDLKHTGHVGLDGAYFGDVAFLNNSQNYNHLPRQIVTPYKPSEDIEQTPLLLPPTPTSPDSLQTASGYFPEENVSSTNPTFINSNENTPKQHSSFGSSFDFPPTATHAVGGSTKSTATLFNSSNPFANEVLKENLALHNNNSYGLEVNAFTNVNLEDDTLDSSKKNRKLWLPSNENEEQHEYHEISDDEITSDKVFDLGPSLLDEINSMFGSINASSSADIGVPKSPDVESINKRNEFTELTSKLSRKSSNDTNGNKSKKKNSHGEVKAISVKDEKILNHAIEIANEISARSMTDLVSDNSHQQVQSPKRKFSFRFPHLTHHNQTDKDGNSAHIKERKNFSEELQSIPDLQRFRSLNEIENPELNDSIRIPLFDKESSDFCFQKSREILSRPINFSDLQPVTSDKKFNTLSGTSSKKYDKKQRDFIGENLLEIENTLKALNLDFMQSYNQLDDKTDSAETLFDEKVFSNNNIQILSSAIGEHQFKLDFPNHLEKQLQYATQNSQIYQDVIEKLQDEKRSSTPDTGFASRETNLSRRSSQKSSYSPQDSYFSPKDSNFPSSLESRFYMNYRTDPNKVQSPIKNVNNSNSSIHSHQMPQNSPLGINDQYGTRQRSMSFTDEIKSPVLSEPIIKRAVAAGSAQQRAAQFLRSPTSFRSNTQRNCIAYKPRSIKARTLRRLSYNPIIVDSSSSSDIESDIDRSMAQSECDIRSKMSARKRRQYLNRKAFSSGNEDGGGTDKIYGSNASIKSAPHYHYERRHQNFAQPQHVSSNLPYNYELDFGGKFYDFRNNGINTLIKPPRGFNGGSASAQYSVDMFSEFDVSKLTGKSPTSYLSNQSDLKKKVILGSSVPIQQPQQQSQNQLPAPGFQWPEKIHASAIKQNDLIWRQQQATSAQSALFGNLKVKQAFSSDSSSSGSDGFRGDFIPRIPPSPAP